MREKSTANSRYVVEAQQDYFSTGKILPLEQRKNSL